MRTKILIIILLFAGTLGAAYFADSYFDEEKKIKKEIEKAGYCEADPDCEIVPAQCPFGCFVGINKKEVSRIKDLVDDYESTCVYSCIEVKGVECVNKKCQVKIPGPGNIYENKEFGFSLRYPGEYEKISANYEYLTRNSLITIGLPEDYYKGTNLSEAIADIGASRDDAIVKKCLEAQEGEVESGEKVIAEEKFQAFKADGAAAGNRYESLRFRIVKNGVCYELVQLLHSGNIGNYPENTVREFDKPEALDKLDEIVRGFSFE